MPTEKVILWIFSDTQDDQSGLDNGRTWSKSDEISQTRWINQSVTRASDEVNGSHTGGHTQANIL